MPITKSAKKALAVSLTKRAHNAAWKKRWRQAKRTFLKKRNSENLAKVYQVLDKMAKLNIFHQNKAARIKSKMSKKLEKKEDKKSGAK